MAYCPGMWASKCRNQHSYTLKWDSQIDDCVSLNVILAKKKSYVVGFRQYWSHSDSVHAVHSLRVSLGAKIVEVDVASESSGGVDF